MLCKFNVKARQTGKTINLIEYAIKAPIQKIGFIVPTYDMKRKIIQKFDHDLMMRNFLTHVKLFSAEEILYNFIDIRPNSYDTFLIDEYLFFTDKQQCEIYNFLRHSNVYVKINSTPYKLFDPVLFGIVKSFKENGIGFNKGSKYITEENYENFFYLYNNFLTDPKTLLKYDYKDKKMLLGKYFETEYCGKLFK